MEQVKQFVEKVIEFRQHRISICNVCPSSQFGVCTECACVIQAKVLLEDSECPLNKW